MLDFGPARGDGLVAHSPPIPHRCLCCPTASQQAHRESAGGFVQEWDWDKAPPKRGKRNKLVQSDQTLGSFTDSTVFFYK